MKTTRVLFDGRPLSDPHSSHRGIGVFTRSLLGKLAGFNELAVGALVQRGTELPGGDPVVRPPEAPIIAPVPYLLYVGVYGPHKGYAEVFEVISEPARLGFPHRLKVVGTLNPWREQQIAGLLEGCRHPERVDLMGFVSNDELRALYGSASALIVTSRCEGFGLPALEAMATGTPVIAFANTALPEVIGTGGTLVPDGDVP